MKKQNKKTKNKQFALVLCAALILFIAGCATSNTSTGKVALEQKKTIDIGVITPLTGEASSYGLAAKKGLDFAAKEINSNGGILGRKIVLHYEDSELDNKKAVTIMSKFVNLDNYDIIISADGSGPTTAIAPMADETKTLLMATLASTPKLSTMGDYVFRTIPSDNYQGQKIAEFADRKGYKTAAILYANDAYGTGIRDVFRQSYSGRVVAEEAFSNGETDFKTQLAKIKNQNPETIILAVRNELPNVLSQIKSMKIQSTLIGTDTTKDEELMSAAGASSEGMYSVFFAEPTDYKGYRKNFEAEYGNQPPGYSDYSYDAVYAISEAIHKANSLDPVRIKEALYSLKFRGATGIVEFDSNGDVTNKPFTFFKVVNGKFVGVSS